MNKCLNMLGLCARARKIAVGAQAVEISIKKGDARLVIIDEEASEETKKAFQNASSAKKIPFIIMEGSLLGDAIGKPGRRVAAVTDDSFADRIRQLNEMNV